MFSATKKMASRVPGLRPAVFTPFNDDLSLNLGIIPNYAKYLVNNGIKSILVGGTTGEHPNLSVESRKKVINAWLREKESTGLHIQVQIGGAPFEDVISLAKYCESVGVNSLLVLPELYFKPQSVEALVSYSELVANAAPNLPFFYYHIPVMSNVHINMPAFVAAATTRIPNFKGLKFTSNDLNEVAQILRILKHDQDIYLGGETLLAPAALLGLTCCTGSPTNLFPKLAQSVLDATHAGDQQKARGLQEKLSVAIDTINAEGGRPAMKAAMEIVTGIKVGPPTLPNRPVSSDTKKRIVAKLKGLDLL